MINHDLTISMKNVGQHVTQWNIVYADKVVVSTIQLTKQTNKNQVFENENKVTPLHTERANRGSEKSNKNKH